MIENISTSLKLAVVVFFALACAGQQTTQNFSEPATGQATPDVVSHSFDSPEIIDNSAPAAKAPAPVAATPAIEEKTKPAPVVEAVKPQPKPVTVAMQAAVDTPPMATQASAAPAPSTAGPEITFQQRRPRYLLRPGDVFDINFEYSPEFNQTVTVQPDGYIALREAGDIYVQGLSVEQLNQAVRKGYAEVLHAPSIAIVPKNFEQPYFVVGGEVKTPGKFDLRGPLSVAEAVAMAGGFTESAKHSSVMLFHRESPDQAVVVRTLNIKRMLNHQDLKEDAQLHPGDMIYVPQNTMSKVKGFVVPRASVGPNIRPTL